MAQLALAAGDGIAVEPGDAGQQGDTATTVLAGEKADQQPAHAFVGSSKEAVEDPMLSGQWSFGMLSAGWARTGVHGPLPLRVGQTFLGSHGTLPPFEQIAKGTRTLYSSIAEILVGH